VPRELVDHFQRTAASYDEWYDTHPVLFRTELAALRAALPRPGRGLEIGAGTGRFAAALSLRYGLDPSPAMLGRARHRGLRVVQGLGEALPFKSGSFDIALIVFVIEFVDDVGGFLAEAARVLRDRGRLVVGFMDKDSAWGRHFHKRSSAGRYFHPPSPQELIGALGSAGLRFERSWQTLFAPPPDLRRAERPRPGFGRGGLVVFRAAKGGGDTSGASAVVKRRRNT
jgi:SAM-dependent methyltransferase